MSLLGEREIVYEPWPLEVIKQARDEFWDAMHEGAGIEEISAGLLALDFLTRASDVPESYQMFLDSCISEARMRIELLGAQEAEQRTQDENIEKAAHGMRMVLAGIRGVEGMIRRRQAVMVDYEFDNGFDEEGES